MRRTRTGVLFTDEPLSNRAVHGIMPLKGERWQEKRGREMNDGTLSATTAAQIAGLPYRTLAHWCEWGLLTFAQKGSGIGHRRRFSVGDLVKVLALARLRAGGASMQAIKAAVAILAAEYGEGDPLGSGRLLVIEDRPFYLRGDADLVDVLRRQTAMQSMILVDLGQVAQEARAKVTALERLNMAA